MKILDVLVPLDNEDGIDVSESATTKTWSITSHLTTNMTNFGAREDTNLDERILNYSLVVFFDNDITSTRRLEVAKEKHLI